MLTGAKILDVVTYYKVEGLDLNRYVKVSGPLLDTVKRRYNTVEITGIIIDFKGEDGHSGSIIIGPREGEDDVISIVIAGDEKLGLEIKKLLEKG